MRQFKINQLNSISMCACGQMISPGGFIHHKRNFDQNVLILISEGILHITNNGIPFDLFPGQYIILKAGEEHFGSAPSSGKLSYMWAHFVTDSDFSIYEDKIQDSSYDFCYSFPEIGNTTSKDRLIELFHQLADMCLDDHPISQSMRNNLMSLILMELTRQMDTSVIRDSSHTIPPVVASVAEWIRVNYYLDFNVTELSNRFGYQADYLSSLFKKHMGVPLTEYTNTIRIKASKTLLTDYDLGVKEAAYSCGFSDEKYYMKVFKRIEGVTPSTYKKTFARKFLTE